MPRFQKATLTVGGTQLSNWTEYEVTSDLTTPADAFAFSVAVGGPHNAERTEYRNRLRELLAPGQRVSIHVRDDEGVRAPQLAGVIDSLKITAGRGDGTIYAVHGRDLAAYLVDSDAPLDLLTQAESTRFLDVVVAALDPWNLDYTIDAGAQRDILTGRDHRHPAERLSRDRARAQSGARAARGHANGLAPSDIETLTLRQAKPQPGQSVWEYLSAHAARLHLMLWMGPGGDLVVGAPNYDQAPSYRFTRRYDGGGNVLDGGPVVRDSGSLYSEIEVYGRAHNGDAARSPIRGTAFSPTLPHARRLVVHDQSIRTTEEAEAHARRLLSEAELGGLTISYATEGHGQDGLIYAPDTTADVDDEPGGVSERMYMVGRTLRQSRDLGTTAEVRLIPRGAIQL